MPIKSSDANKSSASSIVSDIFLPAPSLRKPDRPVEQFPRAAPSRKFPPSRYVCPPQLARPPARLRPYRDQVRLSCSAYPTWKHTALRFLRRESAFPPIRSQKTRRPWPNQFQNSSRIFAHPASFLFPWKAIPKSCVRKLKSDAHRACSVRKSAKSPDARIAVPCISINSDRRYQTPFPLDRKS